MVELRGVGDLWVGCFFWSGEEKGREGGGEVCTVRGAQDCRCMMSTDECAGHTVALPIVYGFPRPRRPRDI